jgi:uncharacterized membrane protein YfcA
MKTKWYIPGEAYDWEKTLKHFLYGLILTVLGVGINYSIDYLEIIEAPPEYVLYVGLLISILQAFSNIVKHWKDEHEDSQTP